MKSLKSVASRIARNAIHESEDDFVGVWGLVKEARIALPDISEADLRLVIAEVLQKLVSTGLTLGYLTGLGFVAWEPSDDVDRVFREWDSKAADPGFWDAWLSTKDDAIVDGSVREGRGSS